MNTAQDPRIERILETWFGILDASGRPNPAHIQSWWKKDPDFDETLRSTWGRSVEEALRGELDSWATQTRGRLALILLLDQWTRNLYRGSAGMFRGDEAALGLAQEALAAGIDLELLPIERVFLYMPLMHSERLEEQRQCVALFTRLVEEAPEALRDLLRNNLDFAQQHCVIVERFGRFPHRNALLGRASTEEERLFLEQPGSSF